MMTVVGEGLDADQVLKGNAGIASYEPGSKEPVIDAIKP